MTRDSKHTSLYLVIPVSLSGELQGWGLGYNSWYSHAGLGASLTHKANGTATKTVIDRSYEALKAVSENGTTKTDGCCAQSFADTKAVAAMQVCVLWMYFNPSIPCAGFAASEGFAERAAFNNTPLENPRPLQTDPAMI
eukprot:3877708-Amphidinium_carterae.1